MTDEQITEQPDRDRVQMVSIAKDGTADQTPDFEIIGDRDVAEAALAEQLGTVAVARVDAEHDAAEDDGEDVESPQPEDYEAAVEAAQDEPPAIIDAHFAGDDDTDA